MDWNYKIYKINKYFYQNESFKVKKKNQNKNYIKIKDIYIYIYQKN